MRLICHKSFIVLLSLLLVAIPCFSQTKLEEIQEGAELVGDSLAKALPFNSTIGLNWSDAYIGQLISIPPHFGVGIVGGFTNLEAAGLLDLMNDLGAGIDKDVFGDQFPLPALAAEGRIGGFMLPFDLGLKIGFIPESAQDILKETMDGLVIDYLLIGGDIRYALLKGNILLPTVSVGLGVNYLSGGVGMTIQDEQSFTLPDNSTIEASKPELGFQWESTTIDLKAQVSKSFLLFTPYLGVGAAYGSSTTGYYLKSTIRYNGQEVGDDEIAAIKKSLEDAGITPPDVKNTGIVSSYDVSGWALRTFGGLSLNFLVAKLDITGLYNLSDGNYGFSIGMRVQL